MPTHATRCLVILSCALFARPGSAAQESDSLTSRFEGSAIDSTTLPSPGVAWGLSVAATVVPVAVTLLAPSEQANIVAGAAVLVGPATGYFYGGCAG